jgi:hypothetical protein
MRLSSSTTSGAMHPPACPPTAFQNSRRALRQQKRGWITNPRTSRSTPTSAGPPSTVESLLSEKLGQPAHGVGRVVGGFSESIYLNAVKVGQRHQQVIVGDRRARGLSAARLARGTILF